jgi:histidine triad (HIT) family protein
LGFVKAFSFSGRILSVKAFAIHFYARLAALMNKINPDCIFCRIVSGNSPATILYRDEQVTAFRDLHPVAPIHILIVPNRHIESVNALEAGDEALVGHIFNVARILAEREGIREGGYRIINNTGVHGGQTVFHMHFHLIGGQRMKHPMG